MAVAARRSWPREKRRAKIRRKDRRETVKGFLVAPVAEEGVVMVVVVGARRSLKVPVSSLASVEVRAKMDTFVAGEFEDGMEAGGG